jgi:mono/diheme cytochrome c family protein
MSHLDARHLAPIASIAAALLLALLPVGARAQAPWQAPPEADGYSNPNPANAQSVAAGKDVYLKYCVLCHGEQGRGNGPSAQSLEPKPANFADPSRMKGQSDGDLAWKIVTGRGPMPSWEPVLSEAEIWNVINYVRTFAK